MCIVYEPHVMVTSWFRGGCCDSPGDAQSLCDHSAEEADGGDCRCGSWRDRDGHPTRPRRIRLHDLRWRRRLWRNVAQEHLPRCGLRRALPLLLLLVRAEPAVEQD